MNRPETVARTVARNMLSLFVDDGSLAIGVLAWLALAGLALRHLKLPAAATGPILFLGLAAILLESVTRRARNSTRTRTGK